MTDDPTQYRDPPTDGTEPADDHLSADDLARDDDLDLYCTPREVEAGRERLVTAGIPPEDIEDWLSLYLTRVWLRPLRSPTGTTPGSAPTKPAPG